MFQLAAAVLLVRDGCYLASTNVGVIISPEEQRLSIEMQKAIHIMNQPWRDLQMDIVNARFKKE